jgi:hypothetical protein
MKQAVRRSAVAGGATNSQSDTIRPAPLNLVLAPRRVRMNALAAAGVAFAAAGLAAISPGLASAAAPVTFGSTGTVQTYTVPAGVTAVVATAVGGTGGNSGYAGGVGGVVSSNLPVTPGETLYVYVGGNGAGGPSAAGGFNGGGNASGYNGGASGGGASDVRTTSGDLTTRLLVAGGGGGGGSHFDATAPGGNAGNPNGADGQGADSYGNPGGGGTQSAGGTGGSSTVGGGGGGGALGVGGGAGLYFYPPYLAGGAGGGGYYGGGGGGSFSAGGGGSDYVGPSGYGSSYSLDATSTPSVTISAPISPSSSALTFGATPTQSTTAPQTVTVTNVDAVPVQITGETFDYSSAQNGDDYFVGSSTCGGTLQPGGTCQLGVRFNPQGTGASNSGMFIQETDSSGNTNSAYVALSGTTTGLPQGPAGATGATGTPGATGATGTTGGQGTIGTTGETGATGTTGAQGTIGITGATGAQGTIGTIGTTGLTGLTGLQGPGGANGHRGPRGDTGRRGLAGKNGSVDVISCDREAGQRTVCTFYLPAAAGFKVTAQMVSHSYRGSNGGDVSATGSARGGKGVHRIILFSTKKMSAGTYLVSLTYRHGKMTYTSRQTVHVS